MLAIKPSLLLLIGAIAWSWGENTTVEITSALSNPFPDVVLTGQVTDKGTGAAVQGARLSIEGDRRRFFTDQNGHYTMGFPTTWEGRRVTLVVKHRRYKRIEREIRLSERGTLDIKMEPAPHIIEALDLQATVFERRVSRNAAAPAMESVSFILNLPVPPNPDFNTEAYDHIQENTFLLAAANPLSTFSIDVDRASYANVRRFIHSGVRPPIDAVRIEELINYFPYHDPPPRGEDPLAIHTEVAPAPWQPLHRLVRIALKGQPIDMGEAPSSNLVFLLDVSGSMNTPDKLPLLKTAFGMLVDQLRPDDRVAIVVYAGAAGLVLPSTPGSQRETILEALQGLEAGGSTAGGAGIRLAYDVAAENHMEGGNNRVILATDGDFNVGVSSDSEMIRLIEEKRRQGTFLTVLGFGTGNLKDSKMEQIADHGNGNFSYIDSALEAKKVLVEEMGGTLLTIAKDVKIQVEFNPSRVEAYRLIGYENRLLAAEDFNNDAKDAGEMGAGHSVTALYEVIPVGIESPVEVHRPDSLRYRWEAPGATNPDSDELLFVKLRYKDPDQDVSKLMDLPVVDGQGPASEDFRFASAVAAWGMLLRNSDYCTGFSLGDVVELASSSLGEDKEGYRHEFVRLVETANTLDLISMDPGRGR